MVSFRVGRCASSAAKTGSCFADESVALRFAVRIPLEIIARNFSLLFRLEMSKGEFFMNKAQTLTRRQRTYRLVSIGILVATEIVCNRFLSVNTSLFKIGVAFLPVVLAAWLYGPVAGALVGGLGDLIGALLFPIGPYFPGFTLTAALAGAGYGFCLCPRYGYALHAKQRKKTRSNLLRITVAVLFKQILCSQFLGTLFVWFLYSEGKTYWYFFVSRLLTQTLFMLVVEWILTVVMLRLLDKQFAQLSGATKEF